MIRVIRLVRRFACRFVCELVGHDRVRGPGSPSVVQLRSHGIDGVLRCRDAHATVRTITCGRCGEALSGEVLILGPCDDAREAVQ